MTHFRLSALLIVLVACAQFACGTEDGTGPANPTDLPDLTADLADAVADGPCTPACEGKECGEDGCGGSCGECQAGLSCVAGICATIACTENAPCDDQNPCTADDTCVQGLCAGTAYTCDDEKDCTKDECDGAGDCVFSLKAGRCLINGSCYEEGEGRPDNSCQECMTAVSQVEWANDDTNECDDGNACIHEEYCLDGLCEPGDVTQDCNDSNACTGDSCDPDKGCVYTELHSSCDDGDACTHLDKCADNACSGVAVDCDDENPCTKDSCDSQTGCTHEPVAGSCDDGNACTVGDSCDDGACQPGTQLDCNDSNPCTTDTCAPANGCSHTNVPGSCDDNNACTIGDLCGSGTCQPGQATLDCDDSNPCTADTCDPATGCVHTNVTMPCNDNDNCTVGDTCQGGSCQPGQPLDCSDGDACTDDFCITGPGCQHSFNTAPCDDTNACTEGDTCSGGVCGGVIKTCSDANPCTTDSCNPFTQDGCVFTPNDLACDDGDPCSLGDTCSQGSCQAGAGSPDCDDSNPCTADSCQAFQGCKHAPIAGFCDDGNSCTQGDFCANGQCVPGGNVCTCQNDADCEAEEDGNACNGTLYCDTSTLPYSCKINPATVVTCDTSQDTPCAKQICQTATGQCVKQAVNENGACTDGNGCTSNDHCSNGLCVGTICGEGLTCINDECVEVTCASLDFDGVDDYVSIPHSTPLAFSGNFTVSIWFKTPVPGADRLILRKGTIHPSFYLWLVSDLTLKYGVYLGSTENTIISAKLEPDSWYHFVLTYDGTTERGYLNGKLDGAKVTGGGPVKYQSAAITLGYGYPNYWTNAFFSGQAAQMAVWNQVLTPTQIQSVMTLGIGQVAGTAGWWPMNEGVGGSVADLSGNNNPGSLLSGTGWAMDAPECTPGATCGDGTKAPWEECDDGNLGGGDGCSTYCVLENTSLVPSGTFWMGCNEAVDEQCEGDEYPYHQVDVPSFEIDLNQVTVAEYEACMDAGACSAPSGNNCNHTKNGYDNHPVNCVTYAHAKNYCEWVDKRLCSEAEWEKAARGGCALYQGQDCAQSMPKYPWGNGALSCDKANYWGCGGASTEPVGSSPDGVGPYGNFDMVGNLWDWVEDCYHSQYYGAPTDGSAWIGNCTGEFSGTVRGGSYMSGTGGVRTASRHRGQTGVGGFDTYVAGIRCCR